MLSGLGNLLFGGGRVEGDTASVDQTQASPPPVSLLTQDTDNDWVLVNSAENGDSEATAVDAEQAERQPAMEVNVEERQPAAVGIDDDQAEQRENQPLHHHQPGPLQQQQGANAGGRGVNVRPRGPAGVGVRETELQELKEVQAAQRCQRQTSGKQLSKRALNCSNKARTIRKHANSQSRALRPSGQMNGRQPQRQY